ncbi:3-oxoacyl-[acyl-carrier-protein] synthase III C-terminal domain-containing protein [Streptomyces sp. CC208A]|uniref:3-oxoacyl-[acyl-carrier-protein] synthase III C-terminal domain-containing protein n=1 Tax=Streptomyces sp. CC208A TaxID=3044573 RepID=UPI0024A8FDD8|nr:3-oxoacyl-[acyl-carrier-protein] synthase III C-terminal domain-containing protein [Streptomyces sp. CC208A]
MNGRQVRLQAVRRMAQSSLKVLSLAGRRSEELRAVVAHQADERIVDAVAERFRLPDPLMVKCIRDAGNTTAASVHLARRPPTHP